MLAVQLAAKRPDAIVALNAMKPCGSFMATSKRTLHQYWRENLLIDLTSV